MTADSNKQSTPSAKTSATQAKTSKSASPKTSQPASKRTSAEIFKNISKTGSPQRTPSNVSGRENGDVTPSQLHPKHVHGVSAEDSKLTYESSNITNVPDVFSLSSNPPPGPRKYVYTARQLPRPNYSLEIGIVERRIDSLRKSRTPKAAPCASETLKPDGPTWADLIAAAQTTLTMELSSSMVPMPRVMFLAPDFKATAVHKGLFVDVKLSDYRGKYLCLFFYPMDFTFVCPTEITAMSMLVDQFKDANCAILGCSCDSQFVHLAYMRTPPQDNGLGQIAFPLMSDYRKAISCKYNVLTPEGSSQRALFIIDPVGIIRHITVNDSGVGRNTDEVLRMLLAIKSVDDFDELCPDGWLPGSITIVPTRQGALDYYRKKYGTDPDDEESEDLPDMFSIDEGNELLL